MVFIYPLVAISLISVLAVKPLNSEIFKKKLILIIQTHFLDELRPL